MKNNQQDRKNSGNMTAEKTSGVKTFFTMLRKLLVTVIMVCIFAGIILTVSAVSYIIGIANEPLGIDLEAKSLNLTSFIYCENPDTGKFEEYQTLYDTENRVWVDFDEIPKAMKDAIIAIEDKRFEEHNGVDWIRTGGAVLSLFTGQDSYGGSTITQQLIKNVTLDNDVSLTRKIREIFRALKLEDEYNKDQILEAYLNVVNFGNNCQGVQSAAKLYFDKDISECSIAECAAIAGITQNPSLWNPLIYPENNQKRREDVLSEMYNQGKITETEYEQALEESENMTFVGFQYSDEDEDDETDTQEWNWYIDVMFRDLRKDLAEKYNITEDAAEEKIYTEGLKIYCAMDLEMQEFMEQTALSVNSSTFDEDLQTAFTLIESDGRVVGTVGSTDAREGKLLFDRANTPLQPGSSIKPLLAYPSAIEQEKLNYSSIVEDQPYDKWAYYDGIWHSGPNNVYGYYNDYMTVADAIEWSSNAVAVRVLDMAGISYCFDKATQGFGFENLDSEQDSINLGGLSLGGLSGGVTVREMASAYNYLITGGKYYEPYTYYYVTDQNDNIILDNRNNDGVQVYSEETAGIMNRLLHYNVTTAQHTQAWRARVSGWDIIGKTGTTDDTKDSWFCGCSPYASLAVWTGYDDPKTITGNGTINSLTIFQKVMTEYLSDKKNVSYELPDTLISARYCKQTGLLASSSCSNTDIGYYTKNNMPNYCSVSAHNTQPTFTESYSEDDTEATEVTEPDSSSSHTEPTTAKPTVPTTEPTEPSSSTEDHTSPTTPTSPPSSEPSHTRAAV